MLYARKIKMKSGCNNSYSTKEIAEIYVDGCAEPGFFPKHELHDYLKKHPSSIKVSISPFPYLVPATSSSGEKYVRSEPNDTSRDNLLKLPRV
jgi:hypothetical protein